MTRCLICHAPEEFAFLKHRFTIIRCPNCGLFRTLLPGSYHYLLNHYYSQEYFIGSKNRAGYANYLDDHQITRRNAHSYLDLIHRHQPNGKKLLDIGCATGIFLQEAESRGYQVNGIDVSEYAVDQARKFLDHQVKHGTLSTVKLSPREFNIITMFDVFEHLKKPLQDLRRCHRLLKPNGLLVINTGNTNSFLAKLEGKNWHFFIPPQHLFFYSDTNLKQLLHLTGFKTLAIYTTGKYISLRYLWHLMRTINHSSLADFLYRLFNRSFIGRTSFYINLHDNMTIIAKKI